MNILDEYSLRNSLGFSFARHNTEPTFLLFRSISEKWNSRWCILTTCWYNTRSTAGQPGAYKFILSSPKRSDSFSHQSIYNSLSGQSFYSSDISYEEFEGFFCKWDLVGSGIEPLFNQHAFLSMWEIFVFINEKWFQSQSKYARCLLSESLDQSKSTDERTLLCEKVRSLGFFRQVEDTWSSGFVQPFTTRYLSWFESFYGNL